MNALKDYQTLLAAMLVAAALVFFRVYHPEGPAPSPSVDVSEAGHKYAVVVAQGYADASEEAAKMVRAGQPLSMARDQLHKTWQKKCEDGYDTLFHASMVAIVPEGGELTTVEQRERFAQFLESLAKGSRGVK